MANQDHRMVQDQTGSTTSLWYCRKTQQWFPTQKSNISCGIVCATSYGAVFQEIVQAIRVDDLGKKQHCGRSDAVSAGLMIQ